MSEEVDFRGEDMSSEKNDLWFYEMRRQMDDVISCYWKNKIDLIWFEEEWRQSKNE